MKGLRKRAGVLAAVALRAMSSLAGCSKDFTVDNNKVAAVVGDSEITLGLLNFYARYDQAGFESSYGSYYGDKMWKLELTEGTTLEESEKEGVLDALKQAIILENHMEEYGVSITAEDMAKFETVADKFIEANGEAAALVSGDKAVIVEFLRLCTIQERMYNAMVADVSTEVPDEEAAQKKLAYLGFTETDAVSLEDALKEAEEFLAQAKERGDLIELAEEQEAPANLLNYDDSTTTIAKEIMDAANALQDGEFAEIVKKDKSYYVVQLVSSFDKEATEIKKEQIVQERQDAKFDELYGEWVKSVEVTVYDEIVEEISLHGLKVTDKVEQKENK